MLRNYLITALRNLRKYKGFSFINLLGLAIGMACCILILLYVRDELSFDRYHANADRIYRVTREWFNEDGTSSLHLGHVAPPIAPLLQNDFPDIQEAVRIQTPGRMLCSREDKHFLEESIVFAEENLFAVFSFELLAGDPETALRDPFTLVITEEAARKYFGDQDPLGQTLKFENRIDAKVTGIVRAAPPNSHFHFVSCWFPL
ncbi:ABC transporter permease [Acidobacteriota bacterium]